MGLVGEENCIFGFSCCN